MRSILDDKHKTALESFRFVALFQGLTDYDPGGDYHSRPEGKMLSGSMELTRYCGDIKKSDDNPVAVCPMFLRTISIISPERDIVVNVKNPSSSDKRFHLILNDESTDWVTVPAGQKIEAKFTPKSKIAAGEDIALKIEGDEEIVFLSIKF